MLRISYISPVGVVEKPKVTTKQNFINEAMETLALRQHKDMLKAKEQFATELLQLENKEARYNELAKKFPHLI